MAGTRILLVDNGSYEPAATLALRRLAKEVGQLIGREVRPVSTMHSTKIDPALLGGVPAVICCPSRCWPTPASPRRGIALTPG